MENICTENSSVSSNYAYYSASINTGDKSISSNTGDFSYSIGTGRGGISVNTGDRSTCVSIGRGSIGIVEGLDSKVSVIGENSVAIVANYEGKASGSIGSWIVFFEKGDWDRDGFPISDIKAFKVDGKEIKENTFYRLINGKLEEVGE